MTQQIQRKKKQISKQLQEALEALSVDFGKLQPKVDECFSIGRDEGKTDKEIGKLVREKMKAHYTRMTIWTVLKEYPKAALQKHKSSQKSKKTLHFDLETLTQEDINRDIKRYTKKQFMEIVLHLARFLPKGQKEAFPMEKEKKDMLKAGLKFREQMFSHREKEDEY